MILKRLFLILILVSGSYEIMAQYVPEKSEKNDTTILVKPSNKSASSESNHKKGFDSSRLVPGGNFALSFGNPYYIDISPSLGYMVTDDLLLGLGATYIASGGDNFGYKYNFNFYGGRILGRHKLFENFFANAELDLLNVPYFFNGNDTMRRWLLSPLVGASYVMPFGKRGGIQATLLYNLNYQELYSPFPNPLIWRIGFFL